MRLHWGAEKALQIFFFLGLAYTSALLWLPSILQVEDFPSYKDLSTRPFLLNGDDSWIEHLVAVIGGDTSQTPNPGGGGAPNSKSEIFKKAQVPIVAVVVPAPLFAPEQQTLSETHKRCILEGYRTALLTGAPWVFLTGSASECAAAASYLTSLAQPFQAIFPNDVIASLPLSLKARLRRWMEDGVPPASLEAWFAAADPIPALDAAMSRRYLSLDDFQPQQRLIALLEEAAAPVAATRYSVKALASFLFEMHRMAFTPAPQPPPGPAKEEASKEEPDDIVIYETVHRESEKPAAARKDSLSAFMRRDGLSEEGLNNFAGAIDWRTPRLWRQPFSSKGRFILPGLVQVPTTSLALGVPSPHKAERVAEVLQQLLERHAVLTLARYTISDKEHAKGVHASPVSEKTWQAVKERALWLLHGQYTVAVVGRAQEHFPLQLMYRRAFLQTRRHAWGTLRKVVSLLGNPLSDPSKNKAETLDAWVGMNRSKQSFLRTRIVVFHSSEVTPSHRFLSPFWLPFTAEEPPGMPENTYAITRYLAVYSYYLYRNYCRWRDAIVLAGLALPHIRYLTTAREVLGAFANADINSQDLWNGVGFS